MGIAFLEAINGMIICFFRDNCLSIRNMLRAYQQSWLAEMVRRKIAEGALEQTFSPRHKH
jgi:hypothetical protein